ncbi:MAG: hypothetical protein OHK0029_27960 [Armatimonadaceae bacterium]
MDSSPQYHFSFDYQLLDLPTDEHGNILYRDSSTASYEAYIRWLADYLYTVDYEISPQQREDCESALHCPDLKAKADSLGCSAAWQEGDDFHCLSYVVSELIGGWEDLADTDIPRILDLLQTLRVLATEMWDEETEEYLEEDPVKEETEQVRVLRLVSFRVPDATEHDLRFIVAQHRYITEKWGDEGWYVLEDFAEIGWRVPLAILCQRTPTREERIEILRCFFQGYTQKSRK